MYYQDQGEVNPKSFQDGVLFFTTTGITGESSYKHVSGLKLQLSFLSVINIPPAIASSLGLPSLLSVYAPTYLADCCHAFVIIYSRQILFKLLSQIKLHDVVPKRTQCPNHHVLPILNTVTSLSSFNRVAIFFRVTLTILQIVLKILIAYHQC